MSAFSRIFWAFALTCLSAGIAHADVGTVTPAGTTNTTAAAMTAQDVFISSATANAGVILAAKSAGQMQTISNLSAQTVLIYPPVGGTINGLAANASITIEPHSRVGCIAQNSTTYACTYDWQMDDQIIAQSATYTLTSTTNSQQLFNATTNGALTTQDKTTYFWNCAFSVSSMSATSGNAGFDILGAGTATVSSAATWIMGADATTQTTPTASSVVFIATTGQTGDVVTAATNTGMIVNAWGVVRITTGGTLIPSIKLTTAASAVVAANSYCRLAPVSPDTMLSLGNWN